MSDSFKYCARLTIAAVLILLTPPVSADARPGYEVHPGATELILPLGTQGGYVVSLSANERQRVQFAIDGLSSTTEYSTTGHVSSQHIEATFGNLGWVDIRLQLVRDPSDPSHNGRCKGYAPLYREGTYRGIIDFTPQGGLPEVVVKSGRAYFEHRFRQVCERRRPPSEHGGKTISVRKAELGVLAVEGMVEDRAVTLQALDFAMRRNPERSWGHLAVAVYERREGVQITRRATVSVDYDSFAMSTRGKSPETVEVKLPEPFTGRALYLRSPDSSVSWTGDLSVDLSSPDRIMIPLTGPGFGATLCRSSSIIKIARCSSGIAPTLGRWPVLLK